MEFQHETWMKLKTDLSWENVYKNENNQQLKACFCCNEISNNIVQSQEKRWLEIIACKNIAREFSTMQQSVLLQQYFFAFEAINILYSNELNRLAILNLSINPVIRVCN